MVVRTLVSLCLFFFFFSSRRRHTRFDCDWSSDVCSSDLYAHGEVAAERDGHRSFRRTLRSVLSEDERIQSGFIESWRRRKGCRGARGSAIRKSSAAAACFGSRRESHHCSLCGPWRQRRPRQQESNARAEL